MVFGIITKYFPTRNNVAVIAIFISISFLLGINSRFITLYNYLLPQQSTSYQVTKKLELYDRKIFVTNLLADNPLSLQRIFLPRIEVRGNEGCMCMYFQYIFDDISSEIAKLIPYQNRYLFAREKDANKGKYNLVIRGDVIDSTKVNLLIEIYEGSSLLSWFKLDQFSYTLDNKEVSRRGMEENFYQNSIDLLLHNNFWSYLLESKISNELDQVEFFLDLAIDYEHEI